MNTERTMLHGSFSISVGRMPTRRFHFSPLIISTLKTFLRATYSIIPAYLIKCKTLFECITSAFNKLILTSLFYHRLREKLSSEHKTHRLIFIFTQRKNNPRTTPQGLSWRRRWEISFELNEIKWRSFSGFCIFNKAQGI